MFAEPAIWHLQNYSFVDIFASNLQKSKTKQNKNKNKTKNKQTKTLYCRMIAHFDHLVIVLTILTTNRYLLKGFSIIDLGLISEYCAIYRR